MAGACRLSKIELFRVPPRWLFVRLETDDGAVGWGEASLEGHAEAVEGAFAAFRDRFLGADPERIEDIWQVAYRGGFYRGGPVQMSALAGLDQALWDLKGRRFGVPAWQLLGGQVRDKVAVYAWIGGDAPHETGAGAKARKAQGFNAVKMNATPATAWLDRKDTIDAMLERVAAVQAEGMDIGLDFHGRIHKPLARQLAKALEPMRPLFIEEPLLSENIEGLEQISRQTTIPIALGERLFDRWGFKPFLERSIVDIIQPDLSHAGGLSECRRIAAMAEAYDVAVAPHCPLGPLALGACLQLAVTTPNFLIQEMSLGIHYNTGGHDLLTYCKEPSIFDVTDGYVRAPTGPGLGVDIDEDKVRALAGEGHGWRNPIWRTSDGALAEW